MSEQYPNSWKNCATCAYWVGPRDVDDFGSRVYVSSYNMTGKCMCRFGGWHRQQRQAGMAACNDYRKWPVIE